MALESFRKAWGGKGTPSARRIQPAGELMGFHKCDFVIKGNRRVFGDKRDRFVVGINVTGLGNKF